MPAATLGKLASHLYSVLTVSSGDEGQERRRERRLSEIELTDTEPEGHVLIETTFPYNCTYLGLGWACLPAGLWRNEL